MFLSQNRAFQHGQSPDEAKSSPWKELTADREPAEDSSYGVESPLKDAGREKRSLDTNNNPIESVRPDDLVMKNELPKPEEEQRNREPDADTIKMYELLIILVFIHCMRSMGLHRLEERPAAATRSFRSSSSSNVQVSAKALAQSFGPRRWLRSSETLKSSIRSRFVGQIPRTWTEKECYSLFKEFGAVYNIKVLKDRDAKLSKGRLVFIVLI